MIILMAVSLLWTGCKNEGMNEPKQKVTFPISICLPVDEIHTHWPGSPRRVMGDPGTGEEFLLPNYIYIIVMKQDNENEANWAVWEIIERTATDEDWVKKRYAGLLESSGDSVYQYTGYLNLLLNNQKFNGRVYAIASAVSLSFNKSPLNTIANLSEAEGLTFSAASSTVQENLQHIYSTPYNYKPDGVNYYGSFSSKDHKVPHLDLLLYHVAAKVDINWSVADSARVKADGVTPIRLTTMKACNLFNGNAYCFKPMENVYDSNDPLASGAEVSIVSSGDESLWWEGRAYFYTIPYTTTKTDYENYFPLQMQMVTNGTGTYTPTIYMQIDKSSPFVPWLRATFNIKNTLSGSGTKKVDLPTP